MKVLVLSELYPSPVNPVLGIFIHQQVKEMLRQGLQAKVVCTVPWAPFPLGLLSDKWKDYGRIPARAVWDGVEVVFPRYLALPRNILFERSGNFMYGGLRRTVDELAGEFPFDLIHAHAALPGGFAGARLKNEYTRPLVVTVHGKDLRQTLHLNRRCREALREVFFHADRVITVSSKLRDIAVRELGFADRIITLHNGFSLEDFDSPSSLSPAEEGLAHFPLPLAEEGSMHPSNAAEGLTHFPLPPGGGGSGWGGSSSSSSSPNGGTLMISISNLVATKGIDLNLQAIALLARRRPDLPLRYLVVGDGPQKEALRKLAAELGLSERISFLGQLPHAEAMRLLATAHIFCLPSWSEGFGVVYLEAMALGKAVIACRGEGIADIIRDGENGFLVEPRDVHNLAAALERLLTDPAAARAAGARARETAWREYTWEKNVQRLVKIYEEVAYD